MGCQHPAASNGFKPRSRLRRRPWSIRRSLTTMNRTPKRERNSACRWGAGKGPAGKTATIPWTRWARRSAELWGRPQDSGSGHWDGRLQGSRSTPSGTSRRRPSPAPAEPVLNDSCPWGNPASAAFTVSGFFTTKLFPILLVSLYPHEKHGLEHAAPDRCGICEESHP